MAASPAPGGVKRRHRRRPGQWVIALVRALNTILAAPLALQLFHLADLLADVTTTLAHPFGSLFQAQDVSGVGSLAEGGLASRCWHADLRWDLVWLAWDDWLGVCWRRSRCRWDQGCVSVVHFGGRLAARLAGESRRLGYVCGGIWVAPGRRVKCWCTRYKGILVKGKQGKGKGSRKGLYSLVEVGDNETDKRQDKT